MTKEFYDSETGKLLMQVALQGHIIEKRIVKKKNTAEYLDYLTRSYELCTDIKNKFRKLEEEFIK